MGQHPSTGPNPAAQGDEGEVAVGGQCLDVEPTNPVTWCEGDQLHGVSGSDEGVAQVHGVDLGSPPVGCSDHLEDGVVHGGVGPGSVMGGSVVGGSVVGGSVVGGSVVGGSVVGGSVVGGSVVGGSARWAPAASGTLPRLMGDSTPPPTWTVVIPTYQRVETLGRALSSVLAQTGPSFEVVVVDDGSVDGTAALLSAIEDPRVQVLRQDNQGRSAARNVGAARARGEWVTFLDSDDEALPGWLASFDRLATPERGLLRSAAVVTDGEGRLSWLVPGEGGTSHRPYPRGTCLPGTFAVRRAVWARGGGYDPDLDFAENTEVILRLALDARAHGWQVGRSTGAGVRIHREPMPARTARYGGSPRKAAETLLARYPEVLAGEPDIRQDYWAIVGTGALRQGHRRAALAAFVRSWWARPLTLRAGARIASVALPERVRSAVSGRRSRTGPPSVSP